MILRPAVFEDCLGIWLWRNAADVRAVSCNPEPIPYAEHRDWFTGALGGQGTCRVFVLVDDSVDPIGTLNWARYGPLVARVSIILDHGARGRRLAAPAICLLADHAARVGFQTLEAVIRAENASSLRAFKAAGFTWRVEHSGLAYLTREL